MDGSTAMTTLISPLRRAVQVGAENIAVTCGEVRLTYRETWERCGRLISALRGVGVGAGDRVAIVGPNSHRYLECYQAVPGAGMVIVPEAHGLTGDLTRPVDAILHHKDTVLLPSMNVREAAAAFDRAEAESLAVVDSSATHRVAGLLSEAHTLRRYAEESEQRRRELLGEA